jgi:hypothetical protein
MRLLLCMLLVALLPPVRGECSDRGVPLIRLLDKRAFPTAEGDGAQATADVDSSWTVHYVTSKSERGTGSLHAALNDPKKEKLLVLFAVGGFFDLTQVLYAGEVNGLILAGQTANDLGGVHIGTASHSGDTRIYLERFINFQLRFLDIKGGWWHSRDRGSPAAPLTCRTCWWGIVDHHSAGWGSYCGPIGAGMTNRIANDRGGRNTFQRSLCVEGGGLQNTGTVTGIQADWVRQENPADPDEMWSNFDNLTVHHNILLGLTHRFPNTSGNGGVFRILNNLVFGWLYRLTRHTGGHAQLDFVDNEYAQTAATPAVSYGSMNKFDGNDYYNMNYEGSGGTYQTPVLNLHAKGNRVLLKDGTTFHDDEVDAPISMWRWFSNNPWGSENAEIQAQHYTMRGERSRSAVPVTMTDRDELRMVLLENVGSSVRFNDEDATTSYDDGSDQFYLEWVRTNGGPERYSSEVGDGGVGDTDRQRYSAALIASGSARNLDEFDADRDGLPDDFEEAHGVTDPWAVKERWSFPAVDIVNTAGYVNIQMYLAWKAGDFSLWYVAQGVYNVTYPDDPSCQPSATGNSAPSTGTTVGGGGGTGTITDSAGSPVDSADSMGGDTQASESSDNSDTLIVVVVVVGAVILCTIVAGIALLWHKVNARAAPAPKSPRRSMRMSRRTSTTYHQQTLNPMPAARGPPPPVPPPRTQW